MSHTTPGADRRGISPTEISVQLFTVQTLMSRDAGGTLSRIADLGFRQVEMAGTHGLSADRFRTLLDARGLAATSGHRSYAELLADPDRVLGECAILGHRFVVCPWLPPENRSIPGMHDVATSLNRLGELARRRGIRLGYHNHDFEFIDELNGAPFEALMAATDPDLVHLELDVYWVAKAGRDPLQLLRLYGDRVLQMHLKDLDWAGGIADLGTGTLDLRGLIQEGQDRRVTEYIIEHDNPVDPFATVSAGLAYISNWSRARGAVGSVR